jgi:hypothetical protein
MRRARTSTAIPSIPAGIFSNDPDAMMRARNISNTCAASGGASERRFGSSACTANFAKSSKVLELIQAVLDDTAQEPLVV